MAEDLSRLTPSSIQPHPVQPPPPQTWATSKTVSFFAAQAATPVFNQLSRRKWINGENGMAISMRSSCELLWEILILDKHISQENDTYNTHNNGHPLPIQHSACCMLFYRLLIVIRTSEGGAKIYALYLCALHF